jgi:hypothetical protein
MNSENEFTNDIYTWKENQLDHGPDIFWKVHHNTSIHPTAELLSKTLNWASARYAILMNCEGHHAKANLDFDEKVHTIQPIDINHTRHHFFPWWYDWMQNVERELQLHQKLTNEENKSPSHVFDAMLGTPWPRKEWVLKKIKQKNSSDFLWNIGVPWNSTGSSDKFLHGHELPISSDWAKPVYNQLGQRCNHAILLPWKIYNNTWFSIILETQSEGYPMVSEKSGKCLLGRRLFVNFGNSGVLKLIRQMGYQTFESVIDESYDDEIEEIKRFEMAWNQVESLLSMNPTQVIDRILPILQHNQQLFLDSNHDQELRDIFKRITDGR